VETCFSQQGGVKGREKMGEDLGNIELRKRSYGVHFLGG
jgi:hypothetical protein